MYVNEQTAQLILDVLTWNTQTWLHGYNFEGEVSEDVIQQAKKDFLEFCKFYGIEGVEVTRQ